MARPSLDEENKYIRAQLEKDKVFNKRLERIYAKAEKETSNQISLFIAESGTDDVLSMAKAIEPAREKARVALLEQISGDAADYLKDSEKRQLLYDMQRPQLTRLQLLEGNIQLNMAKLDSVRAPVFEQFLTDQFKDEYLRQYNAIGFTPTPEQYGNMAKTIVNESYKGAEWRDRLRAHSNALQRELSEHVERTLLSGKHPTKGLQSIAREVEENFTGKRSMSALNHAKTLAITESGRVQTEAQKYSYEKYGIDSFEFIGEPDACDTCSGYIGTVEKVTQLSAGSNACPLHPRCRCSTIPTISDDEYNRRSKLRGD